MRPRFWRWMAVLGAAAVCALGAGALRSVRLALGWPFPDPFQWTRRSSPLGPVILQEIQQLARLETCRYQGQILVRGDTRRGILPVWLAGDRLLFIGRGEVVAGIDLSRIEPEDLRVEGPRLLLRLPPAEVLYSRLDNGSSEVYDRRSGLLTGPDRALEGRVRLEAETRLREAALERGLLEMAEENARAALRRHLRQLGFAEVRFL